MDQFFNYHFSYIGKHQQASQKLGGLIKWNTFSIQIYLFGCILFLINLYPLFATIYLFKKFLFYVKTVN